MDRSVKKEPTTDAYRHPHILPKMGSCSCDFLSFFSFFFYDFLLAFPRLTLLLTIVESTSQPSTRRYGSVTREAPHSASEDLALSLYISSIAK